jgi:hypothetical protein
MWAGRQRKLVRSKAQGTRLTLRMSPLPSTGTDASIRGGSAGEERSGADVDLLSSDGSDGGGGGGGGFLRDDGEDAGSENGDGDEDA